jgi:hypothetical protein
VQAIDHLGSVTANLGQLGQGEQKGKFTGDGANYTLVWEVLLDARDGMLVKGSGILSTLFKEVSADTFLTLPLLIRWGWIGMLF